MKITAIQIENLRGFQSVKKTELSESINVFIGANNSGKSTILNSIFYLQRRNTLNSTDMTIGKSNCYVDLYFSGKHSNMSNGYFTASEKIKIDVLNNTITLMNGNKSTIGGFNNISEQEPNNLIYQVVADMLSLVFETLRIIKKMFHF